MTTTTDRFHAAASTLTAMQRDRRDSVDALLKRLDALQSDAAALEEKQLTSWSQQHAAVREVQSDVSLGLSRLLAAQIFSDAGRHADHSAFCVSTISALRGGDTFRIRRGPIYGPLLVPAGVQVVCSDDVVFQLAAGVEGSCITLSPGSSVVGAKILQRCPNAAAVRILGGPQTTRVTNCRIESDNMPGLLAEPNALVHCEKVHISSDAMASLVVLKESAVVNLEDCTLDYTTAASDASTTFACHVDEGSELVAHNTVWQPRGRNAIQAACNSAVKLTNCCITGGKQGVSAIEAVRDIRFVECDFADLQVVACIGAAQSVVLRTNTMRRSQLSHLVFSSAFDGWSSVKWISGNTFEASEQYGVLVLSGAPHAPPDVLAALISDNIFVDNKLGPIKFE